jgi:hypothetical protein
LQGSDRLLGDHGLYDVRLLATQQFVSVYIDVLSRASNDTIYGGAGNDFIMGQQGADYLVGGPGEDDIIGASY